MSPALKQNVGGHGYQDDRALETVVTRWLITRGHGLVSKRNRNARPAVR